MALDPARCTLYHGDGGRVGRRQLSSWNASTPLLINGQAPDWSRSGYPVGPAMCTGSERAEVYVAYSGTSQSTPRVIYAIGIGGPADSGPGGPGGPGGANGTGGASGVSGSSGSSARESARVPPARVGGSSPFPAPPAAQTRVLVNGAGASPTKRVAVGGAGALSGYLFYVSNSYLYRSDHSGKGRKVISYKAVSSTNATLVKFSVVGAIALDNDFGRVYVAASYSDRAMIYSMGPHGAGAETCYYVYMGSPRRNAPIAMACGHTV